MDNHVNVLDRLLGLIIICKALLSERDIILIRTNNIKGFYCSKLNQTNNQFIYAVFHFLIETHFLSILGCFCMKGISS